MAATIVGSAVATNNPPPKNSGFGTAQDSVSFTTYDAHTASVIASLEHRFGRVEVIENETQSIPGSINTYQLRAQDPHGPFSGPMLSLVSGRYPSGADEVAVTSGVASDFHLSGRRTPGASAASSARWSASSRTLRASSTSSPSSCPDR